jgi:hypothetical protein
MARATANNGGNVLDKKRKKSERNEHPQPIEPGRPFGLIRLILLGSTFRTYGRGGQAQVTGGYYKQRECVLVPIQSSLS